ncbi:hypothetical protein CB0940_11275 [Cercospora beticola]|uniref:Zinc finger CCCH domain-containing protein 45 n=1 Tax=Cercospora beticola TaxID=122368 RepID=A0A2G5HDT0_CERBT|nr:hypothetical protein CB0940_11275 [Cercospora beticola]PIA90392.1 hypothetical protein CB0940_11275 [Cercospora beticola]WPB08108.1 hypothetical protein RHO25_012772 [Cercospora beticola]CAK1368025.1 unnamed protein product [Cercospora beticola]
MGDMHPHNTSQEGDRLPNQQSTSHPSMHQQSSAPFHSQFEYLSQNQTQSSMASGSPSMTPYGQQSFDMGALAASLPQNLQPGVMQRPYGGPDASHNVSTSSPYASQQAMFTQPRGHTFDPALLARAQQQQQYLNAHYGAPGPMQRPQQLAMQGQLAYSPIDPYGYGMAPSQYSPIDPRFVTQNSFPMGAMHADMTQFNPRPIDTAPVPNYPRGPPRKPKQSGHALWVGNLPPAAAVVDLKDHFSRDATDDIESVFLIAKSNCAFVNYRTEAACVAAMNRFHDSRFHGVRLVCRLRRGTASTAATPTDTQSESQSAAQTPPVAGAAVDGDSAGPTIARSHSEQSSPSPDVTNEAEGPPQSDEKVPEKYYIVKSLTSQDLEASVRNGVWATQSHNEKTLNRAFGQADNVYLIFSANKSGEYFGYARMESAIEGEPVNLSSSSTQEDATHTSDSDGSPQSIHTPATATAPKGRIIDDSARGTIFWEADHGEIENGADTKDASASDHWGKQFKIEWLSTSKLPFYRTRGLRNPWNANREVKIARDGTELEPSVGKRLVQMFHRPQQPPQPGTIMPGGMQFPR